MVGGVVDVGGGVGVLGALGLAGGVAVGGGTAGGLPLTSLFLQKTKSEILRATQPPVIAPKSPAPITKNLSDVLPKNSIKNAEK